MTAHLELMSKQRLIAIIRGQAATITTLERAVKHERAKAIQREVARSEAVRRTNAYPTPEETRRTAQTLLDALPVDPLADEHRDDLAHAVWGTHALVRAVPDRNRCTNPSCRQPLTDGRCGRCNTTRRAA